MEVPAFSISWRTAFTGAKNRSRGAPPAVAYAVILARGVRPWALAKASDVTTVALPPSLRPGALPAVTVPSFLNTGLSRARVSGEVSLRGDSSWLITVTPPFPFTSSGTISSAKRPASCAATAFWWLSTEKASCSCRLMPAFSAVYSAYSPMWFCPNESQRPSWIMPSTMVWFPALMPVR